MKYLVILLPWLFMAAPVFGQAAALQGTVIDEQHSPLPGAVVQLSPGGYNTTTDCTLQLPGTLQHLTIELSHQADLLDEVVIQDNFALQQKKESSYNSEVVGEN